MTRHPDDLRAVPPSIPPTSLPGTGSAPPLQRERVRKRVRRGPRWLRQFRRTVIGRLQPLKIAAILLSLIAVAAVAVLVLVSDATNRVENAVASLNRVVSSIGGRTGTDLTLNDFTRLQSAVADVSSTLSGVRRQLAFLQPISEQIPDTAGLFIALDAALELANAGGAMLNGLQPTLVFLVAGEDDETLVAPISSGQRVVELLRLGRPSFLAARETLGRADAIINRLAAAGSSAQNVLNAELLAQYARALEQANTLLINAPDLLTVALGLEREQSYLVLAQNSDEIRPPGGYLSTYGWFTVRNGRIENYAYSATTANSPNPPPASMAAEVQVPDWWITYQQPIYAAWDGSWDVDFPTTAQRAMWYYNSGGNPQSPVDGVIAIDIVAFERILGVLGSVTVPGYNEIVTEANFREVIYDIRASGEGDSPHKRFLAALYRQIFSDWQSFSATPETGTRMISALLELLRERHIMLVFTDAALNQAVDLLGWNGRQLPATAGDYLLVADANLGNKANRSVVRQTTYDVQIQADGSASSRLSLIYDYSDSRARLDPAVAPEHGSIDYNNLLQVFVPVDAQLESATLGLNAVRIVRDAAHTRLISRFTVAYDRSERYQFIYTTPGVIEPVGNFLRYELVIQKQPGIQPDVVNVQIALPPGAVLINATPTPSASYPLEQLILEYRLELTTDLTFEVIYQLGQ
ncbi:MAG: DUF4012 domain-containing protein [Candidatus Flexifilum sp.]